MGRRRRRRRGASATTGVEGELGRNYGVIKLLFETPSGFAIFSFDGAYLRKDNAVEHIWPYFVDDFRPRFVVWLKEFKTFEDKSIAINLETGAIHIHLIEMLKRWCDSQEKLVVGRAEYKTIIERNLGITCLYDDTVEEVMWGLKNSMHTLVPQEKTELTKEDRLPMSQGLNMFLRRHEIDIKPEMINKHIVETAYVIHHIYLREKEHLRFFHCLDGYFMDISGIDSKDWSLVKLATAVMMICYPDKIDESADPAKILSLHEYSKIAEDASLYEDVLNKRAFLPVYKDVVSFSKKKSKMLEKLECLVKEAKEVGKEVECYSENVSPALAGPEGSLALENPGECSVNFDGDNTDVVDGKSDRTVGFREFIGDLNASSLQKCSPLISDPESQSTCSRKVAGFMENSMDIMSKVSPRLEIVGPNNVESETVTNSGTNFVPTGNELKQVDSTSLTMSNQTSITEGQHCLMSDDRILAVPSTNGYASGAEDVSVSSTADPMKDNSDDASVNDSMHKGEAHTSDINFVPFQVLPTELSTMPTSQEINALNTYIEEKMQTGDTSANDMPAEESIGNVEEKKQTEGASAKEMNALLNADNVEEKLTEDASTEMNVVQHTDDTEGNKQAENTGAKKASAARSMENVEEKNQSEDTGAKGVSAVRIMKNVDEESRTEDTSAKKMDTEFNVDEVEDKKQSDDTSEEATAVQHTDNVKEKKQAQETSAKEINAVQSTDNVEEKKLTEGTVGPVGNEQNEEIAAAGARFNSGRIHVPLKVLLAEEKKQAQETSAKEINAVQSTYNVEEKKLTEGTVDLVRNELNDEIAAAGIRFNSGRIHVPLKVLAEECVESKEKKTSTKEQVLSFRRRASKDDASSVKSGSCKVGLDDQYNNVDKRSRGRKWPWMLFICCHSVH